jgi:hypothetical protein
MPSPRKPKPPLDPGKLTALQLNAIIPLEEAAELSSLSKETWVREHSAKIIHLSPHRKGVRVRDALFLP